jgi:hypothetical protein
MPADWSASSAADSQFQPMTHSVFSCGTPHQLQNLELTVEIGDHQLAKSTDLETEVEMRAIGSANTGFEVLDRDGSVRIPRGRRANTL